MSQVLRDYQRKALVALRATIGGGKRRVLLVAPTGSGKTTIASAIMSGAAAKGSTVLFLAHRRELIDQCVARLAEHEITAGVIMAGRPATSALVQVASIQTLARRAIPSVSLVIVDEAHHARAKSYQRILDTSPSAAVIGLTATPWRTDGRGLGELFQDLVVAAHPDELIAAGHLCPVTGFSYAAPELGGVHTKAGDYDEDEAAQAMSYLGGDIIQRWLDHRPGRTVLFACTVEHSLRLADAFRAAGVAAEHLDGTTPLPERAAILARLAAGTTDVVTNCAVLTEGWDLPELRCVILARPTKSVGLYLQMAGRGLRPVEGKTAARIHDHAGNALRLGLVDERRDYSLAGDSKRAPSEIKTRTCPACYAIFPPAPECPACGYEFPPPEPRQIEHVDGQEVAFGEIAPRRAYVPEGRARAAYVALAKEGRASHYKPGWAKFRFKQRFGFWPKREWSAPYDAAPLPALPGAVSPASADAELRLLGALDASRRQHEREAAEYETAERPCGAAAEDA